MREALRNAEYRALWFAEAQSCAGDQLAKVALAIMVYGRTGSPLWAAIVYALTFLPALAGGLGLSQLADRYPRRAVLATSAAVQGVLVGCMAIPGTPLPILCVLLVAVQLAGAPANAAQNAITREVFANDEVYLRSQDLRGITMNTVMLLGLGGGGLLVTAVGTSWALAIDAATFLVSAVVVRCWVANRPAAAGKQDSWFGSIRWVAGQRPLRVLIGLSWLVGLAVVPEGLAAPLAHEMGESQHAVGWLLAADPLGFVVGAFLLSHYVSAEARTRLLGVLALGSVATLLGFAWKPNLTAALVLLMLAGAIGAYIITVTATFSTWVPNEMRGGASGVYRTGLRVAQGVGVALGGAVAQATGSAAGTVAIAGMAGVLLAVPVAISWTRVRVLAPAAIGS
ncbi:MFS transporter [Amycolatopsis sp. K13G38]|uniref:MFS transporter n=1 Tax=Amycolatopsis acididurans TaxID=2724524 RepID=A0ABX1JD74_9PSEU|nr:MFS transporter [Amycolatopsis acididurans]NKQ57409.1 MFS transporter [Amycolatopsis acididurans]